MTHRKIRARSRYLSEEVFAYTPGESRRGMNEKETDPSDDTLFDESTDDIIHYNDHEHGDIGESVTLLRTFVLEIIKKSGSGYALYTKHKKCGKRRKLGSHKTKAGAERQERAIHANGG